MGDAYASAHLAASGEKDEGKDGSGSEWSSSSAWDSSTSGSKSEVAKTKRLPKNTS
jgi:hypothetical protein